MIAARKATTLSDAASQIIVYHAQNKLDYDFTSEDIIKNVYQMLTGMSIANQKIAGSVERTESFIKSLYRDDKAAAQVEIPDTDEAEKPAAAVTSDTGYSTAMALLEKLLGVAAPTSSFDGKRVVQIRLSASEFNDIKAKYDELCTSQSI